MMCLVAVVQCQKGCCGRRTRVRKALERASARQAERLTTHHHVAVAEDLGRERRREEGARDVAQDPGDEEEREELEGEEGEPARGRIRGSAGPLERPREKERERRDAHGLHRQTERRQGDPVEHPQDHEAGLRTEAGVTVAVGRQEERLVDQGVAASKQKGERQIVKAPRGRARREGDEREREDEVGEEDGHDAQEAHVDPPDLDAVLLGYALKRQAREEEEEGDVESEDDLQGLERV